MTIADIFSDAALKSARVDRNGGMVQQKAVASVAVATAANDIIAMIPFQTGFSLDRFAASSDILDTGTDVLLEVGYIYTDDTLTDDTNAFLTALDIAQDAGSRTWPVDDGLLTAVGFLSAGEGFLTVRLSAGPTTTLGNITLRAGFSYNQ